MPEIQKTIQSEDGLHARPAGVFAKTASGFKSKIEVVFNGKTVNGKSSMSLMTLGLVKNSQVTVKAEGEDGAAALEKLGALMDNNFQA